MTDRVLPPFAVVSIAESGAWDSSGTEIRDIFRRNAASPTLSEPTIQRERKDFPPTPGGGKWGGNPVKFSSLYFRTVKATKHSLMLYTQQLTHMKPTRLTPVRHKHALKMWF